MQNLNWDFWGNPISVNYEDDLPIEEGLFEINFENSNLCVRLMNSDLIENADEILIVFNAAIGKRESTSPPFFSGTGLAKEYPGPVLAISDIGTHYEGVNLAWYAGCNNHLSFQKDVASFIKKLTDQTGLNPIFLGSSGGGFAALVFAHLFGEFSTAIVMNPQTDFMKYHKSFVERYLKTCFSLNCSEASRDILTSKEIITSVQHLSFVSPRVLILQNFLDNHHLVNHFSFLCPMDDLNRKLSGNTNGIDWLVCPWGFGHQRIWLKHLKLALNGIRKNLSNEEIIQQIEDFFYPIVDSYIPFNPNLIAGETKSHFPYLKNEQGTKYLIGKIEFDCDRSEVMNLHGWRILLKMINSPKINIDTYMVLYFIIEWIEWKKSTENYEIAEDFALVKERLRILEWIMPIVKEVAGMNHHFEKLITLYNEESGN